MAQDLRNAPARVYARDLEPHRPPVRPGRGVPGGGAQGPYGSAAGRLSRLASGPSSATLSALGQAGVPLATKQGRTGSYTLDRSMSLPPLNFTPREAAAVAVALSRGEHVLFTRDGRTAMQKIMAAMPERAPGGARDCREGQTSRPTRARPDAEIAETI